ncbi:MAG: hypothetical protein Q4G69_07780 [Planctomycetia bacterium]|nr:hypothetical protein [Planctomycetia bacterium]
MSSLYIFCTIFGGSFVLIQFFLMIFAGIGAGSERDYSAGPNKSDQNGADPNGSDPIDHAEIRPHSGSGSLMIFSIRTITTGTAFFGIAGLCAEAAGLRPPFPLIMASFFGFAALFAIYFFTRLIHAIRNKRSIEKKSMEETTGTTEPMEPH